MKKTAALIMACLIAMSGTSAVYGAEYTDVKSNHWAYESVKAMSDKEIIKGYPDGSFRPDSTVTYGEFIKMALIAATGEDVGNAASGHWAANYYDKALELNYFSAWDISLSQLKNHIPRGDMALIVSSILGDMKIEDYDGIQKGIEDVTFETKHEYDIIKSYAAGILTGYTDSTFRPEKTLSRAESAAVIHRLADDSKRLIPDATVETSTGGAIASGRAATYPTSELLDMSKLTPDKIITKGTHFTDEYELYTDADVWGIKMYREYNGNSCAFDHSMKGFIYLIKDGELVEYCSTGPMYDDEGINYLGYQRSRAEYDISKVDYIVSVPTNAESDKKEIIKAVVNPFKI